jgi:hypothetical protein
LTSNATTTLTATSPLTLALLLAPALALAQDRPSEGDLFGAPPPQEKPAEAPPAQAKPPEAQPAEPLRPTLEGEPGAEGRLGREAGEKENPLQLGGLLYLRSNLAAREHTAPADWTFNAPSLTDVYLDARPTDRVRGFVLGRMFFDPTLTGNAATFVPTPGNTGSSGGSGTANGGAVQAATIQNPQVLLDQLWLRFDVEQTAFVTAGRQHVKWGVGRFWNPTDYLHPVRRDPLAVFDARTGTTMLRVHVPWEKRGWNFYAVAVAEPLVQQATPLVAGLAAQPRQTVASNSLGALGAGGRAELVVGAWELGLDGVAQRGVRPRFGIDLSGGLWELDVRGELALRTGSDVAQFERVAPAAAPFPAIPFAQRQPSGVRPMAVGGADWSHKYSDEDAFTVGVEYFYDANGYDDAAAYPLLLAAGSFTPFYLGRHYAGAYLVLPRPGSWNLHTFTVSAIANLSDRSGVTRLDWSYTLLTYLTLEAYLQGHLGRTGGEFRFALDPSLFRAAGQSVPANVTGAPVADVGVNLRVAL